MDLSLMVVVTFFWVAVAVAIFNLFFGERK